MENLHTESSVTGTKGLPDFIIIGAMKSGTTSLHNILAHHEKVFIPKEEIYFFDVDDIDQHPDFFVPTKDGWTYHDFDADFAKYLAWYRSLFEKASPGQLLGEDTTTYLGSKVAPARIARLLPNVKLIALLRDPVTRAYSHYWHNVTAGRVTRSFEDTLRTSSGNYYERGNYFEQLLRYKSFLDQGRLKVIIFEKLLRDTQEVIDDVCAYLGLTTSLDIRQVETHHNAARAPLFVPGRFLANHIYSSLLAAKFSRRNIPNMPAYKEMDGDKTTPGLPSLWVRGYRSVVNRLPARRYPPMKEETRAFLQKLFRKRNRGLTELIGQDVSEFWEYMK